VTDTLESNGVTSPDTSVHLTLGVDTCAPFYEP